MSLSIRFGDTDQNSGKSRHVVTVLWRKVGAAVKGNRVRSQEHGHGPAAVMSYHLDCVHIDLVQVGTLFTIDLDIHEILIH